MTTNDPRDMAIFNHVYTTYLDGTYAASDKEADRHADRLIDYFNNLSRHQKFGLVCDLLDRLHQVEIAAGMADGTIPAPEIPDTPASLIDSDGDA